MLWPFYNSHVVYKYKVVRLIYILTYLHTVLLIVLYFTYLLVNVLPKQNVAAKMFRPNNNNNNNLRLLESRHTAQPTQHIKLFGLYRSPILLIVLRQNECRKTVEFVAHVHPGKVQGGAIKTVHF